MVSYNVDLPDGRVAESQTEVAPVEKVLVPDVQQQKWTIRALGLLELYCY